jgi:hypothetical protein
MKGQFLYKLQSQQFLRRNEKNSKTLKSEDLILFVQGHFEYESYLGYTVLQCLHFHIQYTASMWQEVQPYKNQQ